MSRYNAEVLVRVDEPTGDDCRAESPIQAVNVTASDELLARRMILERAWANGLLVSRFISIRRRVPK